MSSPADEEDLSIWENSVVMAVMAALGSLLFVFIVAYLWVWKLDDFFFHRCVVPFRLWRLERTMPERREHTKERFETIDRWLVKKTILSGEDCGCVGDCSLSVASGNSDVDDDDRKIKECGICLQPLKADGNRAVGISVVCQHAFCYDCIRRWLVSNKTCPQCRETYLRIDDEATERQPFNKRWTFLPGIEEYHRLAAERRTRHRTCRYCEREGLVVIDDVEAQQQQETGDQQEASATQQHESVELPSPLQDTRQHIESVGSLDMSETKSSSSDPAGKFTRKTTTPCLRRAVSSESTTLQNSCAEMKPNRRQSWS